jgi:hypothetical protein
LNKCWGDRLPKCVSSWSAHCIWQARGDRWVACGVLGDQVRAACALSTTCVELGGVITALYVLCCTVNVNVLNCTELNCTALHCTALHCTALCTECTVLHITALHYCALHYTAPHCTALVALYCTEVHWVVLHCTALCTALCTAALCTAQYSYLMLR